MNCAAHIWCWPTSLRDDGFAAGEAVDFGHQVLRLDLVGGRFRRSKGCSRCHSLICAHQAARAVAFLRASSRPRSLRARLFSFFRTRFTSPTMGTSACGFLPISAGSISTWITLACGAKAARRPVTRSSKRTPRAIRTIGLGHAHVGGVAAVHAGHADEIGMRAGQPAQTHQRADGGRVDAARRIRAALRAASAAMMPPPA